MTDKVTMKALDTMHISNVQADNLVAGDVFTVSESDAKRLEDAGLAERGGTAAKAVNADAVTPDHPETREEIDAERESAAPARSNKLISAAPETGATVPLDTSSPKPAKRTAKRK